MQEIVELGQEIAEAIKVEETVVEKVMEKVEVVVKQEEPQPVVEKVKSNGWDATQMAESAAGTFFDLLWNTSDTSKQIACQAYKNLDEKMNLTEMRMHADKGRLQVM